MSDCIDCEFPVWGLLPKKETGVTQFLARYPEYDGRGIVIAIFDSGVDPGAAGLQKTSDGKIKVIERFDCSGAGDVDTSTVVQAVDGEITGLTGRKLKIPDSWKNPTDKYHLGIKNGFELYPSKLLERIEKKRKETLWDPFHKTALAETNRKLQEYESKNSSSNLNALEKLAKENLEAKVDVLNNLEKKFKDLGPAYDCVVFHDGTMWRACLDSSETGDLSSADLLGEYSLTHEYATLTKEDQLNYSINVHKNGNTLEIVSMCSGHGTHVASIASAYFPEQPEKNGIAPGAQIVSLSIGDNRLGSMETGTALVRAMIKVMQQTKSKPIHVINMSYGEHAHWSCSGRIGELMTEVVGKHNVTWISSAGNRGPALCTIGTPPDISTNSIIGVGAYVSPEMMVAEYSLREKLPGMHYTWTSRGPTIDGDQGVTVCAPGGAITSVPNFTLRGSQLMNGTSMAAPHVAGAVAILLSGLEQRKLKYSPHSVKRALENSALFLDSLDKFAQGSGLLQVEKAFEHLCQFSESIERDVRFSVQCGASNSKGIHMRSGLQEKPKDISVNVEPIFHEDSDHAMKIDFNMKLSLVCSESWVQAPSHLDLMNMSRMFSVRIDPTSLREGVHSTSVRAYDISCPDKGVVFRVPITVVKPAQVLNELQPDLCFSNVNFKPNTIKRHFILVPDKATWALLRLRCTEKDKCGKFVLHCLQLRPKLFCKTLEFHKLLNLSSHSDSVQGFPVRGGLILEVVVAKYWANLGDVVVDYSIEFHGVKPDSPFVTMQGSDGIHSIEISSSLRMEEILPVITLKNSVLVIRPSDSKISPLLSVRDVIPPSRHIYENVLTYHFHMYKATEITPNSPILSDLLYESEFESQLWMLFDSNKQLLAAGDAYPSKYVAKIEKGDYVLKMHVRHEKRDLLEKLSNVPLLLSQKMSSPLSLDVYVSQAQAMISGKKMAGAVLPPGGHILPIYIAPLNNEKAFKGISVGHYLSGSITYAKDEMGKRADSYPFKYVLPQPGKNNNSKSNDGAKEKEKTKYEEYTESLRELKVNWLGKLEPGEEATSLYEDLKSSFPDHLPIYTALLECLEPTELKRPGLLPFIATTLDDKEKEDIAERSRKVIGVADVIITAVDAPQLLAYAGMKSDTRPDAGKIKTQMEKQKNALVKAYCKKGSALCRLYYLETAIADGDDVGDSPDRKASSAQIQVINNIWREVLKFTEPTDMEVIYFMMWHSAVLSHYGRLVKLLHKLQEEKPAREIDEKLMEVYRKLNWEHCEKFLATWLPVNGYGDFPDYLIVMMMFGVKWIWFARTRDLQFNVESEPPQPAETDYKLGTVVVTNDPA